MRNLVRLLFLLIPSLGFTQSLPKLALADFVSSTMQKGPLGLLTETLRSDLVASGMFAVQDSAWTPGTKGPDKGVVGTVEKFGASWVMNVRVTDLSSGTVDFSVTTDSIEEAQLITGVRNVASRIVSRYRFGLVGSGEDKQKTLEAQWKSLDAEGSTLQSLVAQGESVETYLNLRQYDSSLTPAEYNSIRGQNGAIDVMRTFLQAGMSFRESKRAWDLGLTRLDKYRVTFEPAGLSFGQYLDAYALGLSTVEEYRTYSALAQQDFVTLGAGGVADGLPLGSTDFKFLLLQVAWDHVWTNDPREFVRWDTEAGLFLFFGIVPTPYFDVNALLGKAPYFLKLGGGVHTEILLGGHTALHLRAGLQVASQFEFSVFAVPLGIQPTVNYADGLKPWTGGPDGPIKFPYFGLMFSYKLPFQAAKGLVSGL